MPRRKQPPGSRAIATDQAATALDVPRWQPGLEALDWRERLFTLLYVRDDGDTLKAYAIPYGKAPGWEKRAYAMIGRPDILAAVQLVQRRLSETAAIGLDEVLQRLQAIADASMERFVEVDAEGVVGFDLRTLSAADWRAVKSLTVKGRGVSQEIKLELHDAAAALQTLGRHHGMGLGTVKVIEDEKRAREKLAALLGALTDDELADLERVGQRLEQLGSKVIDGEAVEVETDGDAEQDEPVTDRGE